MAKPAILYVDDEIINLELFKAILGEKYQVLLAENAAHGLRILASQNNIQVVISDMKMPNMNGIQFITKAKAEYPTIYYYILTGYDITSEIQEALNQGLIVQYFRKPCNLNYIESEFNKVI